MLAGYNVKLFYFSIYFLYKLKSTTKKEYLHFPCVGLVVEIIKKFMNGKVIRCIKIIFYYSIIFNFLCLNYDSHCNLYFSDLLENLIEH